VSCSILKSQSRFLGSRRKRNFDELWSRRKNEISLVPALEFVEMSLVPAPEPIEGKQPYLLQEK
jgi:hypothetical protein